MAIVYKLLVVFAVGLNGEFKEVNEDELQQMLEDSKPENALKKYNT